MNSKQSLGSGRPQYSVLSGHPKALVGYWGVAPQQHEADIHSIERLNTRIRIETKDLFQGAAIEFERWTCGYFDVMRR